MEHFRHSALETALKREKINLRLSESKPIDSFGSNIFTNEVMKSMLSQQTFQVVEKAIISGVNIEGRVSDEVADAMRTWAVSKGATHFTHWFQPLTGGTAEKHDSFFTLTADGKAIEKFKGSSLVQQESDASSFPSGGIRETFEARGYTAWDPSSPAFIIFNEAGTGTLCIPSVYISYNGELLDTKGPLLNSQNVINKWGTAVAKIFDRHVDKVFATCGIEQEYFLIDKALVFARPDLLLSGRTLFGHKPAKGQQLEDHYFGSIPSRVSSFMVEFENEALKLGIPVRTRHNEVAPAQYEVAPTFEDVNLACDHNILLMDIMRRIAKKHNLEVVFHEKPFDGINGSGKHNNWSLQSDNGVNLLSPSHKPKESLRFVTFLINIIKAVHDHADLLRATVATAGNEYRLGTFEAPPAIMSIFLGQQMTQVLNDIENKEVVSVEKGENAYFKLGLNHIPSILRDNTDRNRTSPFAFTGDKFEFRAVGSSANSATPMMILNTIVAKQLKEFKEEFDNHRDQEYTKKEEVVVKILKKYVTQCKNILFEGNGYSEDWEKEAKKRGLSNIKSTIEALKAYKNTEFIEVLESMGVLNSREIKARYEIELQSYIKKIQIESRIMGDITISQVIPTALKFQSMLTKNAKQLVDLGLSKEADVSIEIIKEISERVSLIKGLTTEMIDSRKEANNEKNIEKRAKLYSDTIKPYFSKIRYQVDKLELIIADEEWPLIKYRELLYIK